MSSQTVLHPSSRSAKEPNHLGFGTPWATEIEEMKYMLVKFLKNIYKSIHLSKEIDHFVCPNGLSKFQISSEFETKGLN